MTRCTIPLRYKLAVACCLRKLRFMKTVLKISLALIAVVAILILGVTIEGNRQIARQEVTPAGQNAPGQFFTIEGRSLHVITLGDPKSDPTGAPIVLVHGFSAAGAATWMPWAESLHAAGRSVIIPDMLGFGHSERAAQPGEHYSITARGRQVLGLIDALGVANFDIVGESFGGAVTAQVTLAAPERVRKAIFMDAQIYPQPIPLQGIAKVPYLGRAISWNTMGGGPFGFANQRCKASGNCSWLELVKIAGTVDTFQAITASDRGDKEFYKRVPEIKTPSLVIWGGNDTIVPVANGDRLARELGSQFILINAAGHVPYLEQPDKVAERVLNFFK